MYVRLHVKYPLFLSEFNHSNFLEIFFSKKYSNIKFYENPSSASRVVPCGRMEGGTDMLTVVCTILRTRV